MIQPQGRNGRVPVERNVETGQNRLEPGRGPSRGLQPAVSTASGSRGTGEALIGPGLKVIVPSGLLRRLRLKQLRANPRISAAIRGVVRRFSVFSQSIGARSSAWPRFDILMVVTSALSCSCHHRSSSPRRTDQPPSPLAAISPRQHPLARARAGAAADGDRQMQMPPDEEGLQGSSKDVQDKDGDVERNQCRAKLINEIIADRARPPTMRRWRGSRPRSRSRSPTYAASSPKKTSD